MTSKVAAQALRPGYRFVSTLLEDEVNTHEHGNFIHYVISKSRFLPTFYS